jgi:hypothetical protein
MTDKPPQTDAAVLLPLYGWPDEPGLVFTERRADLRSASPPRTGNQQQEDDQ